MQRWSVVLVELVLVEDVVDGVVESHRLHTLHTWSGFPRYRGLVAAPEVSQLSVHTSSVWGVWKWCLR